MTVGFLPDSVHQRMMMNCLLICILSGCGGTGSVKEDRPAIGPYKPATDVVVEMAPGDMICVTEGGDASRRMCVPRVHEEKGHDKKGHHEADSKQAGES
jgi:hypothetical protein